jgi:hypothetical protein
VHQLAPDLDPALRADARERQHHVAVFETAHVALPDREVEPIEQIAARDVVDEEAELHPLGPDACELEIDHAPVGQHHRGQRHRIERRELRHSSGVAHVAQRVDRGLGRDHVEREGEIGAGRERGSGGGQERRDAQRRELHGVLLKGFSKRGECIQLAQDGQGHETAISARRSAATIRAR